MDSNTSKSHSPNKAIPTSNLPKSESNILSCRPESVNSKGNLNRNTVTDYLRQLSGASLRGEPTRLYQVWPGQNVFFFKGRLVCGPDPKGFLLTMVSGILSNWIFCAYICDDSLSKHSWLVKMFSLILSAMVVFSLVMVGTGDPGFIPRSDESGTEEVGTSNGRRSIRVDVNGVEMKMKYCKICKIFRPPRSSHCIVCDNCVEKFDHHCPWIGQCIGLRNYRFFIMFITSALTSFIYIFAFSCWRLKQKLSSTKSGVLGLLGNAPETLSLTMFSFFAIWFLTGLTIFHGYLIIVNQTARENYRKRYADSRNPYDKGMLKNIYEALFRKLPPPKVNFRAEVDPWWFSRGRELKGTSARDSGHGEDEGEVDATQKASGETSDVGNSIDREYEAKTNPMHASKGENKVDVGGSVEVEIGKL
ncbi:putative S-acyltransferase [Acorus gramineus]|uniref:S-acyltransferase n=1 Tax=Acorus gramineus TaxID=55184 RepID=A0AAV9AAB3_ACOGR|nr:putative S-acyltransferase [Acorus gramineus]